MFSIIPPFWEVIELHTITQIENGRGLARDYPLFYLFVSVHNARQEKCFLFYDPQKVDRGMALVLLSRKTKFDQLNSPARRYLKGV